MEIGSKVPGSKFKVGQQVGVGCMVRSCLTCEECKLGVEQYCNKVGWTYDSVDFVDGSITKGDYSTIIIVDHKCVVQHSTLITIIIILLQLARNYCCAQTWSLNPSEDKRDLN
jgi:D-arabinose 1-dehydrogenase-like Zn-dependent alcohol dehydrogenase